MKCGVCLDFERMNLKVLTAILLLAILGTSILRAEVSEKVPGYGGYVKFSRNSRVLIFVHGLRSDASSAWTCKGVNGKADEYWPKMVADDPNPVFAHSDVYVVGYPTPIRGNRMDMSSLITNIWVRMQDQKVFADHSDVVFVVHSMGGLLTEKLLLTYRDQLPASKVSAIFFYGTPQEGSQLADIGKFFNSDPLLKQLSHKDSNYELEDIEQGWLHAGFTGIQKYCAYETVKEDGFIVVDQNSATRGCSADQIAIDRTHRDLVKPCNREDTAYVFLRAGLKSLSNRRVAKPESPASSTVLQGPKQKPVVFHAPGRLDPELSLYEEIPHVESDLNMYASRWAGSMEDIAKEFWMPLKHANPPQYPEKLPPNFIDRMIAADDDRIAQFGPLRAEVLAVHEKAVE